MATPIWFVEEFYLGSKLAQLQADSATASEWAGKTAADVKAAIEKVGMTAFDHFEMFHSAEGTSPNQYFDTNTYLAAKAQALNAADSNANWTPASVLKAITDAGMNVYEHYNLFGANEGVNPSNAFDASSYYDAKLAQLQADPATASEWADKTAADVKDAIAEAGMTPVEHFLRFGQDEGLSAIEVPADERPGEGGDPLTDGLIELQAARADVAAQEGHIATFLEESFANEFVKAQVTDQNADGIDASDVIAADIAEAHAATATALVTTADTTNSIADDATAFNNLSDAAQDARIATARVDQQANVDSMQDAVASSADVLTAGVISKVAAANAQAEALTAALNAQDAAATAATTAATAAGAVSVTDGETIAYTYANGVVTATDSTDADTMDLTVVNNGVVSLAEGVTLNEETGNYQFATVGSSVTNVVIEKGYLDELVARAQASYNADLTVTAAENALAAAVVAVGEAQDSSWDGGAVDYTSLTGDSAISVDGSNIVTLDYSAATGAGAATITAGADVDTYTGALNALAQAQAAQAAFEQAVTDWQSTEALVDELAAQNSTLADLQAAAADALAAIENATDADPAGLGIDVLEGADNFTAGDDVYLFDAGAGDQTLANFGAAGEDTLFIGKDYTLTVAAEGQTIANNIGNVSALEVIVVDNGTDTVLYFEGETFAGNSAGTADMAATITLQGVTGGTIAVDADGFLTIA